jgi:hypothetical protein
VDSVAFDRGKGAGHARGRYRRHRATSHGKGFTRRDPDAGLAPDFVQRGFTADGPNRLWVTGRTVIRTLAAAVKRAPAGSGGFDSRPKRVASFAFVPNSAWPLCAVGGPRRADGCAAR